MTDLSRRNLLGSTFIVASSVMVLGACTATVAPAQGDVAVVRVAPPPPRYEVVPVLPPDRVVREYWQPGYWRWNGHEHVWVDGRYAVRPRAGAVWNAGRWERRGPGWVFVEGHWA